MQIPLNLQLKIYKHVIQLNTITIL
jgi:hypothetical protein